MSESEGQRTSESNAEVVTTHHEDESDEESEDEEYTEPQAFEFKNPDTALSVESTEQTDPGFQANGALESNEDSTIIDRTMGEETKEKAQETSNANIEIKFNADAVATSKTVKHTTATSGTPWKPRALTELREDQDHSNINYNRVKAFWESESEAPKGEEKNKKRKREDRNWMQ